ncbi:MAG: hypothetical protein V2B20_00955 [Pseudomonadota bacterium]
MVDKEDEADRGRRHPILLPQPGDRHLSAMADRRKDLAFRMEITNHES